jgi:hypothetical protein
VGASDVISCMSLTFSFDVCNYTYVQITCLKGKFYK